MTKALTTESPLQQKAFLIYFELGEKRSLYRVRKELGKSDTKISATSVGKWSKRYNWVDKVAKMDLEIYQKTEELAIKNATMRKSEILEACKKTMVKYVESLDNPLNTPNAGDMKKMWEIARIELGLDIDKGIAPVKIVINQKIERVVVEAQNKARQIIEAEIIEEQ